MGAIDFDEVKRQCTIGEVIEKLAIPIYEKKGHMARGKCPLGCCDDTRAARYNGTSGLWYCYQCRKGGSVIDLYQELKGVTVHQAATQLCHDLGKPIPHLEPVPRTEKKIGKEAAVKNGHDEDDEIE